MTEAWEELEGGYAVSSFGRVKSPKGKRLSLYIVGGHPVTKILDGGKKKQKLISQLVAEAFVPLPYQDCCRVRHLDGDKTNNRADNLEWIVPKKRRQGR